MAKILKIDLSKHSGQRMPTSALTIVINILIQTQGSIKTTAKYTNLLEEDIIPIYQQFYPYISSIVNNKEDVKKVDKALDVGIDILSDHLQEYRDKQLQARTKILASTREINAPLDRLIEIRQNSLNKFDQQIKGLNEMIIKYATINHLESGKIEDDSVYIDNQATVFNLLKPKADRISCGETKKPIVAHSIKTGQIIPFESTSLCDEYFGSQKGMTARILRSESKLYKEEWEFFQGTLDEIPTEWYKPNSEDIL